MIKKTFLLYLVQIQKAIFPLIFIPLILGILGTERYGMLAFYYMLLGLLGLLDAGISGTFLKFIATNKNHIDNYKRVTYLFCKVFFLFLCIALTLQLFFYFQSGSIITNWLNTKIDYTEGVYAIKIIGVVLSLLYLKSYLVSFLNGMEKQELVAIWSIVYNSVFYFCGYLIVKYIDDSLYGFFTLMMSIAILDILVIIFMVIFIYLKHSKYLKLSHCKTENDDESSLTIKKILSFSVQLSGLSIIWVIATQIDKFVLSSYIPLSEYAKYQMAIQLSTAVAIFSVPISQILLPRLSNLYAQKNITQYTKLYCSSMCFFIIILGPIIPYFFFCGNELITLWMGDSQLALNVNAYAEWLIASAFISAMMNFIFVLLYSLNKLKQHFYAYAIYSLFTIPLSIYIAKNYGALVTAKYVFTHTLGFMLFWAGWQLYKYIKNFTLNLTLLFVFTMMISSLVFYTTSHMLEDIRSLVLKAFAPPVINLAVFIVIYFLFKNTIDKVLQKVSLKIDN